MGKREIEKYILKNKENMYRIRKELFENPEIGLKENMASELLAAMFREEGFSVIKGIYGLETGFRAEYASGRPGPSIAFICEYDALPEIGHACGHNIIAAMSYGAACGLKSVLDDIGGRVVVFGTPDEERTSGKVNFVEAHAFDNIDAVITTSILSRDYTLIMGITVFFAVFLVVCTLIVDILYVFVDPRIKYD